MKKILLIALVASFATSCNSQDHPKSDLAQNDPKPKVEKPKGNWTVNKEVDENGNIIKYDSIYSYSSMDDLKGMNTESMDSLMNGFTQKFEKHFYSSTDGSMPDIFSDDSPFADDMFKDFFNDETGNPSEMMQKMRAKMEAMRAQMLQGNSIIPAIPNEDSKEKIEKNN